MIKLSLCSGCDSLDLANEHKNCESSPKYRHANKHKHAVPVADIVALEVHILLGHVEFFFDGTYNNGLLIVSFPKLSPGKTFVGVAERRKPLQPR